MILTQEQYNMLTGSDEYHTRGISPIWARRWDFPVDGQPGKIGVPYMIDSNFTDAQKEKILKGMEEIEKRSCIRY